MIGPARRHAIVTRAQRVSPYALQRRNRDRDAPDAERGR
jgi:hypothetical protein